MNQNSALPDQTCFEQPIDEFLSGTLGDDQLAVFENHLNHCTVCETVLRERSAEDHFWNDTRRFLQSSDFACRDNHSATHATILALLDPTDDPTSLGRLAGYEVTGVIGWGGMGIVLKARDVSLDRFVAIKLLHPSYAGQSAPRKRFAREAQAAAAVVHDHVIAIHGVDQWKELPFLVMPYVKGESLQQRIDGDAPLPVDDILRVSIQISRGLAAAHDQGLIHRDVKPANVLMPAGVSRVILTDFGLARAADDASLTRSGVLAGTPQYMSPEQARGETLDARSDLFSLGSVMYAMACGHPPFRSETAYGVLRKITDKPHHPVIELRNDVPYWLSKVIDQLLAKQPNARFETAVQLADHLEACLAHVQQPTTTALPKRAFRTHQRSQGRRPQRLLAIIATVGLTLIGVIWAAKSGFDSWDSRDGNRSSESSMSEVSPPSVSVGWSYDDGELATLESDLDDLIDRLQND